MTSLSEAWHIELDGYPEGWDNWIRENRHVYKAFRVKAIRLALLGHKRCSARYIAEYLRWETPITDTTKQFKIANNMVPGLARLFMADYSHKFPKFFNLMDSLGR